jgi:hypothetical protein
MASKTEREASNSPQWQGVDEELPYSFDFSNEGTPTSPSVKLWDLASNEDVSSTMLSGDASVAGDVVTTPLVKGLTVGRQYKLVAQGTIGGKKYSYFLIINAEV